MGIVKHGPSMGWSGKVGNNVYSQQKNGTTTISQVRSASYKPTSENQLNIQSDTTFTNAILKPLKSFIVVGYELWAKKKGQNQYNAMVSHFRKEVVTGKYPERKVNFGDWLVTRGSMPLPKDVGVTVIESGFEFHWNPGTEEKNTHYTDQVMLLAYLPELNEARFSTAGAQRNRGKDQLVLSGIAQGITAEVYISFISNDRRAISNSVYLGQLIW